MRSEKEMFDLILGVAEKDERVRAVLLNGSRANPAVKKDVFQDYDIVYLVDAYESFLRDHSWVDVFGKKLVYQFPDDPNWYPGEGREGHFGYLMLFDDGNRIDLQLARKEFYREFCFEDRLAVVLLDKDGFLPQLPAPNESSHYIEKPTQNSFDGCRCEFWWVSPYVAKGLWRGQILFAQKHMERCIRKELEKMLSWYAGSEHNFEICAGKCGDRLKDYLPDLWWKRYLSTYAVCEEEAVWQALFAAGALFSEVSCKVADRLGFQINPEWDRNVPKFLRYVKELPRDAKTMEFKGEELV